MSPDVIEAVQRHPCFTCRQATEAEQEQCAADLARAVLTAAVASLPQEALDLLAAELEQIGCFDDADRESTRAAVHGLLLGDGGATP